MEVDKVVDPSELCKNPKLLKEAQKSIGKLDILVCGECHDVFHFVEPFQEHQQKGNCTQISSVCHTYNHESKAQVWAFMLWKNAQLKKLIDCEDKSTPWLIYKIWCNLNTEEKDTWIAAGQALQSFRKISTAKVKRIKCKTSAVDNEISKRSVQESVKNNEVAEHTNSKDTDDCKKDDPAPQKTPFKPVQLNSDVTIGLKKSSDLRTALRTVKNNFPEETVVERILSRRFNRRNKSIEYLINWKNGDEIDNTWEPKSHLEQCKTLVTNFDKLCNETSNNSEYSKGEEVKRHRRASKQDTDKELGKRKYFVDDDDSSDSSAKKIKIEKKGDTSNDKKSATLGRVVKVSNSVNSSDKKNESADFASTSVAHISHKHSPSLSSGVYVTSKTQGIIKLDSKNPPTESPSPGIGLKIGQTYIKLVEKQPGSTSNIRTLKTSDPRRSLLDDPKPLTKVVTLQNNTQRVPISKSLIKRTGKKIHRVNLKKKKIEDEDSDGLEELDFPTDSPLPSPDSPPGDFTLCPLTGKIVGPSGEPIEQDEPKIQTSLDILVQQAVAELSDIDMDKSTPILISKGDDKSIEAMGAKPMISIKTTPTDSVNVPSLDPVNVSATIAVSANSHIPNSTSLALTFISTVIGAAGVASTSIPNLPIVTSVPPAVSVTKATKIVGQCTVTEVSTSKISTKYDIEDCLMPNTITKINPKEALKTYTKSRPHAEGAIIFNKTLANRAPQTSNQLGPMKKLNSTLHTVRQEVTAVDRSSINRPRLNIPVTQNSNPQKYQISLPITHQEPIVKKTSNLKTAKPTNVARSIGHTGINEKPEKPSTQISSPAPGPALVAPIVCSTVLPTTQTVINIPVLATNIEPATPQNVQLLNEIQIPTGTGIADIPTFSLCESATPLLITADDGTVYKVAGQNEEGQTILISEGPDGQQQCLLVSSDAINKVVSTSMMENTTGKAEEIQQTLMDSTPSEEVETECGGGEMEDLQIVAHIVKTEPPSPGGTRKVVLMLPDGNLMTTDVTAEQYAELDLDI